MNPYATIKELREGLDKKEYSAAQLAKFFLARIKEHDKKLNSFITVDEEGALAAAEEADREMASGNIQPLTGIPYAAKDLFSTRGLRTTAASKILEDFQPVYDAAVIRKLREQNAVLLGKTNLDEFAHGSSTETSYFGPTKNPWDLERMPGGSSGGSATAVAAGLVPFALATETGGSIRQPSSLCGVTGWKPTYGRVSRFGVIAMTSSTDSIGAIGRSALDLAETARVMSGFDPKDSTTGKTEFEFTDENLAKDLKGLKIGVPKECFIEGTEKDVEKNVWEAIEHMKSLGAEVREISLPLTRFGSIVYAIVTPSEISSNLSRYDGIHYGHATGKTKDLFEIYSKSRGEGFGDEAKRRIITGTYALSAGYRDAYYLKAQKVRRLLADEFAGAFKDVDVLVAPSSPNVALKLGTAARDPLFGYIADQLNIPSALAGLPAMSVPCGFEKAIPLFPSPGDGKGAPSEAEGRERSLPVGLQIIGPQWRDDKVFQAAYAYQASTGFHKIHPEGY